MDKKRADNQQPFPGFRNPHYTMVPDELFDELLSELSGSQLKTLLYIIRRTFGFKRDSDTISLSQLLHGITARDGRILDRGTGLSKPTLLKALRYLEERNIIIKRRQHRSDGAASPTLYRLNVVSDPPGKESLPGGGKEALPGPRSKKLTTQDTVEQETAKQQTDHSNIRKAQCIAQETIRKNSRWI